MKVKKHKNLFSWIGQIIFSINGSNKELHFWVQELIKGSLHLSLVAVCLLKCFSLNVFGTGWFYFFPLGNKREFVSIQTTDGFCECFWCFRELVFTGIDTDLCHLLEHTNNFDFKLGFKKRKWIHFLFRSVKKCKLCLEVTWLKSDIPKSFWEYAAILPTLGRLHNFLTCETHRPYSCVEKQKFHIFVP